MIKQEVQIKGYLIEVKWGGKVLDSIYIKDEKFLEKEQLRLTLESPECDIEILEVMG